MNASQLDARTQEQFAAVDLEEALREVVLVQNGVIHWFGVSGRPVIWDLALAKFMRADFAKHTSTRSYAVALDGAIAEAEAYHKERPDAVR